MAQYYQVTSLEELHKLYPNLQLDNLEGISCMIQDDQIAHYTDGQGQQVIATIEQSGMQLPQNLPSSQQCTSQQSQYVVHQPTQYVIQQMDTNESQTSAVQYIQQRPQATHSKEEISVVQFKDKVLNCVDKDIGSDDHSLQQCTVKPEAGQQYLPQVQPVLQQPIQLHQQIQAVDVGGNILVLQNQEQQDLFIKQSKNQELLCHASDKQNQQQAQHVLIQRHQEPKPQQMVTQKQMQKDENSEECAQILQNLSAVQSGGQQQQIVHQINHQSHQQQIIQPFQYFNQVTVIDGFSQPRVTVEHHPVANDNIAQQQMQPQMQQFRTKKNIQQAIIQQPQVIVPQRFEMSSPPPVCSTLPHAKKMSQQEIEGQAAPVFIVQKVDSPFLVRQHQSKFGFQSPPSTTEKLNENSYQSISNAKNDQIIQESHHIIPSSTMTGQQTEVQPKFSVADELLQSQMKTQERNLNYNQVKIGVLEQPFDSGQVEQKLKISTPLAGRPPVARIKTAEQQTDSTTPSDGKEVNVQTYPRFIGGNESQPRAISTPLSQMQSQIDFQNQIQTHNRGRGIRGPSPRGYQYVPRARGVQVQTSPPSSTNADRGGMCKRLKSPRGGGKSNRGGWVPSGTNQRQVPLVRSGTPMAQNTVSKVETNQISNENVEEVRMVVLLINGEKKIVKIPCTQNILLGQLLQQAGISLTTSTPITVEQVLEGNSDQYVAKTSLVNNQQGTVGFKTTNVTPVASVVNPSVTPRSIVATIQQRPRVHSPQTPQPATVGIIKHRLHFTAPRMPSSDCTGTNKVNSGTLSETTALPCQNAQNSTPPPVPPKEEPRFIKGFMAICPFCGISSLDFNKCIRCRRKLPENVKSQSIFSVKKKKEKANGGSERNEDTKAEIESKQSDLGGSEGKERNSSFQGCEKKKAKPCIKKKKISDEPAEILILSSDEEEEAKFKKTGVNASTFSVLKKEPVYSDTLTETEMFHLLKESNLNEDLMRNVPPGSYTVLQCRTIRIGSYKVQPKERIFLSARGFKMVVNSLRNETTTVIIPITDIIKVLIHFGKQIPVIFIYPTPKIGAHIRELLGMDNKMGPYYDPTSTQEETHKRITLLLEKITEDGKIVVKRVFGQDKLEELSEKEANEILIRASPVEMQTTSLSKPADSVRKIMVYPPPPEKGGITLNNQDYACLGEDQFLNDVIIDFYLKYLLLKVLSPADRNRTHVFSTFFYKRLTTKPKTLRKNDPENDPKLSPAEKRHMRVKGWTKQVNLFEKDFVIVPINEHSHWFLAIICFPGLTGPVRFSDNTPVEPEEVTPKKNSQTLQIGNTTITHIIKTDGSAISLEVDSGSDRDEAEGDQDDLHPSTDDEGSEQVEEETNTSSPVQIPLLGPSQSPAVPKDSKLKTYKRKAYKEPIKQPCILIFDSLAGASRVRVVATLRDYLKIEYKKKMGQDRDFSKDTIKGAVPKVPQQNNFTDCGLYVLQYVESFFQDPLYDFKLPLKYLQDWFPEEVVSCKRQKLASLIRSLMEEQGIKVEEIGLPALTFANENNAGLEQPRMEDEEVEDEEELNDEEEDMLRRGVRISEFENEDEEMNIEDEEEMEDEDEEDEEYDEDDEDEELEVGEIPRQWLTRASGSCKEPESSLKHVKSVVYTNALVEYEPSDSDEDGQSLSHNSIAISENQTTDSGETPVEKQFCVSDQSVVTENKKNVPLTEYQDFESQISCTTIERNYDGKTSESDMILSESEEVVEEECRGAVHEEETSLETSPRSKGAGGAVTENFNRGLEKKAFRQTEVYVKEDKAIEVTDIIRKLVNDKNITISRKEDEMNSSIFRKHLEMKKFKVKDCDKGEEVNKICPSSPPKTNVGTYKRSFQALKSVRIPKKTDRNLELCSKRQKVDET